jgi:hypothetical protein
MQEIECLPPIAYTNACIGGWFSIDIGMTVQGEKQAFSPTRIAGFSQEPWEVAATRDDRKLRRHAPFWVGKWIGWSRDE